MKSTDKKVKTIEEAVKDVVSPKTQNIEILKEGYFDNDYKQELIEHKDIAGYSVNGDWIAVMTKEGDTYVYPSEGVLRIRHYSVQGE